MKRSANWFVDYECLLTKEPTWRNAWHDTNGQPCQSCPYKAGCRLRYYVTHPTATEQSIIDTHRAPQHQSSGPEVSNANAAEILGITKRQAAKLRRTGQLRAALDKASR